MPTLSSFLSDTYSVAAAGVPTGGDPGEILGKSSSTNYDTAWRHDASNNYLNYTPPAGANRWVMTNNSRNTEGTDGIGESSGAWCGAFVPGQNITVTDAACQVGVAVAGSLTTIAIYRYDSPSSLVLMGQTASIDSSTTGIKSAAFPSAISLAAGTVYVIAVKFTSSGTAVQYRMLQGTGFLAVPSELNLSRAEGILISWPTGQITAPSTSSIIGSYLRAPITALQLQSA